MAISRTHHVVNKYDFVRSEGLCECPGKFVIREVQSLQHLPNDVWKEYAIPNMTEGRCYEVCSGISNCVGYNFHQYRSNPTSNGSCFLLSNSNAIQRHHPFRCSYHSHCIGFLKNWIKDKVH